MLIKFREPVSGLSHFIGMLLSVAGLILLVYSAAHGATVWHVVSFAIFGTSMILLYTASSLYHLLPVSERAILILRKIDHMMIYILIAGTYTPICLVPLRGAWGYSLLVVIWLIAVAGIVMNILWFGAPRWLYTLCYVLMGWIVVVAFWPLVHAMPPLSMLWLLAGGIFYSIGAIIYGTKSPRIAGKYLGFHEIFHVFVLLGSFAHFWFMFRYVLYVQ